MLETIDPEDGDPAEAAAKMAAERPAACGNLFHVAWPASVAQKLKSTPSAVLEFDGANREVAGGKPVSIRRMDERNYLVLTNHYCLRSKELECNRFSHITDAIAALTRNSQKLDVAAARKILIAGELPTAAHTIVFLPDSRTMHVAITRANFLSPRVNATAFSLKDLLKRGNADKEK
jgi:hypothetical protein